MVKAKSEDKELEVSQILEDFKTAFDAKSDFIDLAKEDYEFTLGKQWDDDDVDELDKAGVRAITINKIRSNVQLLSGIESQNRSDIYAFAEGQEDSLVSEIATKLLKNIMKVSQGNQKVSEQFEEALITGEGYLEPYVDYTNDFINGEMRWKKLDLGDIFPEPCFKEYDLSDCAYICKFTTDLSLGELKMIFPDAEKKLEKIDIRKLDTVTWNNLKTIKENTKTNYKYSKDNNYGWYSEDSYDLLEYYYKKYKKHYFVIDAKIGKIKEADSKEEAEEYYNKYAVTEQGVPNESVTVIERTVPEIWVCSVVGNTKIDDSLCTFYPRWKAYPIMPLFAFRYSAPIEDRELLVQGIARGLKDPQRELNKRRTQELRLINTSANSGWIAEEGAYKDKAKWQKHGSSAGILLEYKGGHQKPEKILPTPLSQGHAQLAAENTQDIKEISGINTDLLAMNESQASGRAILLRQKQGLTMVQKFFDNLSQTKQLIGRFLISQFAQVYDVESAIRVMGETFVEEHFSKPVMAQDPLTGEQKPQLDQTGELVMEVDQQLLNSVFNKVLSDAELAKYDVAVGESASNDTIRYSNYMMLLEMAGKGVPITPDVLIEESLISEGSKKKLLNNFEKARQMQEQQAASNPPQKAKGER